MIKTIAYVGMCVIGIMGASAGIIVLVLLAACTMMGLIMWNQQHKISALSPPLASKLK